MKLKEVMTHYVETIRPDAPLQQAAQAMASLDVGMLPVMEGDTLLGTLTDRDITVRATARGLDPKTTPVRNAMTEFVIFGSDSQDIKEAARLMMDNQVRRLLVLDREKELVGIVSLGDLAKALDDKSLSGQMLEQISEATLPRTLEHIR